MQVQSLGREHPWRKSWQPIPVFLPGEFYGQRSLVGYSPWGHKQSDPSQALGRGEVGRKAQEDAGRWGMDSWSTKGPLSVPIAFL